MAWLVVADDWLLDLKPHETRNWDLGKSATPLFDLDFHSFTHYFRQLLIVQPSLA
jgi:hypothetical protein